MHFVNRAHAGRILARQLVPDFRYEDSVVIALSAGGVVVGAQIAQYLHSALLMILAEEIFLPHEPVSVGTITSDGEFLINNALNAGDASELLEEYRGSIEEQKVTKLREMTKIVGHEGLIKKEMVEHRSVILVSDGFSGDILLNVAYEFLKPLKINKLVVATPIADVKAVDWMHMMADKIFCLWVADNDFEINRYFDKNDVPDQETINKIIHNIILNWK